MAILTLNANSIRVLWPILPLVALMSFVGGASPLAVLAYLSDTSKQETRGTTFGVCSMILAKGLIVGPLSDILMIPAHGSIGFLVLTCVYAALGASFPLRPKNHREQKRKAA